MVSFHGRTFLKASARGHIRELRPGERPPDPSTLLTKLDESVSLLLDWMNDKKNILCLTGAGLSTESGIPDYRGHKGAYHDGHKPMIHDHFISSEQARQRYWGRSMVGWRSFEKTAPNVGLHCQCEFWSVHWSCLIFFRFPKNNAGWPSCTCQNGRNRKDRCSHTNQ
mmetsp:Transcript_37082/g.56981  ORF Transcript_37082/g.56981 Transcript_37082/m.56981 type:complete len:167 (-) Transcript_37082:1998-2498(-)